MWEANGDFDPRDFMKETKQGSFEQTCIRQLHRHWFPGIPVKKVERDAQDSNDRFGWEYYSQCVNFPEHVPDLAFIKSEDFWKISIHDLLNKPIEKLPFMKHWEEQPCEVLVFPVIGINAVCYRQVVINNDYFISSDCIIKYAKDGGRVVIETLHNFAENHKPSGGFDWLLGE